MKIFLILIAVTFLISINRIYCQTNPSYRYQKGYVKKSSGQYVQPHYKTSTNKTNHDNYSTKDNTNSWTGSKGHRAKDYSNEAYKYGSGKTIKTGPRSGQYYRNDKKNKVYVPKRK